MASTGERVLPVGLASMPPGPGLSLTLSTVDRTVLSGAQLAVVLAAQGRQVAHEQARLLADAVALSKDAWGEAGTPDRYQADEYANDHVAMTLTVSSFNAAKLIDL